MDNKITIINFLYTFSEITIEKIQPSTVGLSFMNFINEKINESKKITLENKIAEISDVLNDLPPEKRFEIFLSIIDLTSGDISAPTTAIQPINPDIKIKKEYFKDFLPDSWGAPAVAILIIFLTLTIIDNNTNIVTTDNFNFIVKIIVEIIKKLIT